MAAFAIAFAALFTLPGLNSERQLQPSGETASAAGGPSAPDWSTVPIFITNLAGAKDRLQVMSEVMSATSNLGFGSACRVPGVNGSAIFAQPALDRIVMKAAFNHSPTWSDPVARTPGAVGCALSHTRSLKRIVDNGIPIGILMEDDVDHFYRWHRFADALRRVGMPREDAPFQILPPEGGDAFDNNDFDRVGATPSPPSPPLNYFAIDWLASDELVTGWDMLQLQSCTKGLRHIATNSSPPHLLNASTWCSGMFVVSNAGARKLLNGMLPLVNPVDHWPSDVRVLRFEPPLAQQGPSVQGWLGGNGFASSTSTLSSPCFECPTVPEWKQANDGQADPVALLEDCDGMPAEPTADDLAQLLDGYART